MLRRYLILCSISLWTLSYSQPLQADEQVLIKFIDAVQYGEIDQLYEMMHPKLADRIDQPVLEAWLQAVAYRLGRIDQFPNPTLISADDRLEITAEIAFVKGDATVTLVELEGQIVSFEVQSQALENWFQRPTNLKVYRDKAMTFLKCFLELQDFQNCLDLLDPQITKQMKPTMLQAYYSRVSEELGPIQAMKYRHADLVILEDERLSQMKLLYEINGSQKTIMAEFRFHFRGMQGHLTGFSFREKTPADQQ